MTEITTYTHQLHLKIKIKNLAGEARLIRSHEDRLVDQIEACKKKGLYRESRRLISLKASIISHRREAVGPKARIYLLAYAAIRGVPYERVEQKCRIAPNWDGVEKTAKKFAQLSWIQEDEDLYKTDYNTWKSNYFNQFSPMSKEIRNKIEYWIEEAKKYVTSQSRDVAS